MIEFDPQGFATASGEVLVFFTNQEGEYSHSERIYISIGTGLPANAYLDPPPEGKQGFSRVRTAQEWSYVVDHRGKKVYSTDTQREITLTQLGEIPAHTTFLVPPSPLHQWNGSSWGLSPENLTQQKKKKQGEVWEKIKQKRYENGLGGVYIESVGKWFQTGEEEKTKYLGLDKVIDKFGEIDWKCADNTFVKMNRPLLESIFLQIVITANHDHINAEKHRTAMMLVDDPLTYDFSTGWSPIYQESVNEQT